MPKKKEETLSKNEMETLADMVVQRLQQPQEEPAPEPEPEPEPVQEPQPVIQELPKGVYLPQPDPEPVQQHPVQQEYGEPQQDRALSDDQIDDNFRHLDKRVDRVMYSNLATVFLVVVFMVIIYFG